MDPGSPHPDPLEERLRSELGPELEIVRSLGEGGRTRSFLARESGLDRTVVVKALGTEHASDETARVRFEREARSVAALGHPNVVQLYRYGLLSDRTPYLVMQHIKGRSLEETLKALGERPPAEARRILSDVASALGAAHRSGIVHRDVRPGTILLEEETDRALLNDFGVAGILDPSSNRGPRITQTGQILGTPEHMSPEQIRGEPLTAESDVYALGIVAYEILTGKGPYEASSRRAILTAHLQKEPRPLPSRVAGQDPALEDLLRRCLSKEPSHRPRAAEVVRALSEESGGSGVGRTEAEEGSLFQRLRQRKLLQWLGGAAATGWLLLQVVDQLDQQELIPPLAYPLSLTFVLAGITATGVLAWFHGEKGAQRAPPLERLLLGIVLVAWVGVSAFLLVR